MLKKKKRVSFTSIIPPHERVCLFVRAYCCSVCVRVAWVFLPPETLQTGACLTGSEICLFSSAGLFVWSGSVFHSFPKQQDEKGNIPPVFYKNMLPFSHQYS